MVRRSRVFALLAVVVIAAFAMAILAGCTTEEKKTTTTKKEVMLIKPGELLVGSDTSYPPMELLEGDKIVGFDVDLMNAIGDILGYKVTFVTANFDGLQPSLVSKKFDVVASAMSIDKDRAKEIAFSDGYMPADQSLTVQAASGIKTTKDLTGKTVGAQTGTTGEKWAQKNIKGAKEIKSFPTTMEAFTALEAGQVDGIINDYAVSAYIAKDKPVMAVVETIVTKEQYGLAFNKENTELVKKVNVALKEIKSNGKYNEIYKKWFGMEPPK
jgi:ABC-type amino acid transport substrate-binding protein